MKEAARQLGICTETLAAMLDGAPRNLAGAPVQVGAGKARRHLRWDLNRIDEWAAAYRDRQAVRRSRKASPRVVGRGTAGR
jgi:hypothetical protein